MKKMIIVILVVLSGLSILQVNAEVFNEYLPGGKNYIDEENVSLANDVMRLSENILVKSNTTYTFTMPDEDIMGNILYLYIFGNYDYIDDSPSSVSECVHIDDIYSCTFTTRSDELYLNFYLDTEYVSQYFEHYGVYGFQLEEGDTYTGYEEYIDPYIDSVSPVFNGQGGFITSYQSITTIDDIITGHIVAFDEVDGDITHLIEITSDEYTGNEQIIGDYNVSLSVSDLSGNEATFMLVILVKDEIAPVFVSEKNIYLNVDDNTHLESVLNGLEYYDDYGNTPVLTVRNDYYSGNETILGSYTVELELEDQSNNKTIEQFLLIVEDVSAPFITSPTTLEFDINDQVTMSEIIEGIVIEDNYDLNPKITIKQEDYIGYENHVGTYFIQVELSDFSSNTKLVDLTVHIKDMDSPIITGPQSISYSYLDNKTLAELLNLYSISDNYDTLAIEDIVVIEENLVNRDSEIGNYFIKFQVTDSSNNKTEHQLDINIYDDVVPVIFVDEHIIVVELGSSFTKEDAMRLLVSNHLLEQKEYEIEVIEDEYTGNEEKVGEYVYSIKIHDGNDEIIKDFLIKVEDVESSKSSTVRGIVVISFITVFTGAIIYKKRK